jgi:serine/threonine protein kinase
MSITVNIKRIRNKYDINLDIPVENTPFSTFYNGYKLNTIENSDVIIEIIPLKYQIMPQYFPYNYIINFIDTIYDNNNLYIVYENYKTLKNISITNKYEFNKFFNEFRDLIKFIVENKLEIEPIKITDIYVKEHIYVLIKQIKKNKSIKVGSPVYSPPELFQNKKLLLSDQLIWNFGILIYELINGTSPYNRCKDVKDVMTATKNIKYDNNLDDSILKKFLEYNISNRITYDELLSIDITKYDIYEYIANKNMENNKDEINEEVLNKNNDEIFSMEI